MSSPNRKPMEPNQYELSKKVNVCEGEGCQETVAKYLVLRFCPDCRLLQPVPTKNKKRSW